IALADDPPAASRHFSHDVGAEALHDLVERAGNGGKRGELLDEPITASDGFSAFDRLAVAVDRPRGEIALAVGEGLVELHREGMGEIVEDVLARGDVDLDVIPV